jgi:hypothetical protein
MTSVTYGMRKSLCKVMFDMYQGALVNFLNVLDCQMGEETANKYFELIAFYCRTS